MERPPIQHTVPQSPRGSTSRPGSTSSLRSAALSLVGPPSGGGVGLSLSGSSALPLAARPGSSGANNNSATLSALMAAAPVPVNRPGSGPSNIAGGRRSGGRSPSGGADIFDDAASVSSSIRGGSAGSAGRMNHDALLPSFGATKRSGATIPPAPQSAGSTSALTLTAARHPATGSTLAHTDPRDFQVAPKPSVRAAKAAESHPRGGGAATGSSSASSSNPAKAATVATSQDDAFDLRHYVASSAQPIADIPSELFASLLNTNTNSSSDYGYGGGPGPQDAVLDDETEAMLRATALANASSSKSILGALEARIRKLGMVSPLEEEGEGSEKEKASASSATSPATSPNSRINPLTKQAQHLANQQHQSPTAKSVSGHGGDGSQLSPSRPFARATSSTAEAVPTLEIGQAGTEGQGRELAASADGDGESAPSSPERERLARAARIRQGLESILSLDEQLEEVSRRASAAALERMEKARRMRLALRQAETAAQQARLLRMQRAQRGEAAITTLLQAVGEGEGEGEPDSSQPEQEQPKPGSAASKSRQTRAPGGDPDADESKSVASSMGAGLLGKATSAGAKRFPAGSSSNHGDAASVVSAGGLSLSISMRGGAVPGKQQFPLPPKAGAAGLANGALSGAGATGAVPLSNPVLRKGGPAPSLFTKEPGSAPGPLPAGLFQGVGSGAPSEGRPRKVLTADNDPLLAGVEGEGEGEGYDIWSDELGRARSKAAAASTSSSNGAARLAPAPTPAGAAALNTLISTGLKWKPAATNDNDAGESRGLEDGSPQSRLQERLRRLREEMMFGRAAAGEESKGDHEHEDDLSSVGAGTFGGRAAQFDDLGAFSRGAAAAGVSAAARKDYIGRNMALASSYHVANRLTEDEEQRLARLIGADNGSSSSSIEGDVNGGAPDEDGAQLQPLPTSAPQSPTPSASDKAGKPTISPARPLSSAASVRSAGLRPAAQAVDAASYPPPAASVYGGGASTVISSSSAAGDVSSDRLAVVDSMLLNMVRDGVASEAGMRLLKPMLPTNRRAAANASTHHQSTVLEGDENDVPGIAAHAAALRAPAPRLTLLPFFMTALEEIEAGARAAPVSFPVAAISTTGAAAAAKPAAPATSKAPGSTKPVARERPASAASHATNAMPSTAPTKGKTNARDGARPQLETGNTGSRSAVASTTDDGEDALSESVHPANAHQPQYGEAAIRQQREERLAKQRLAMVDAALASLQASFPGDTVGLGLSGQVLSAALGPGSVVGGMSYAGRPGTHSALGDDDAMSASMSQWTAGTAGTSYTRKVTRADIAREVAKARAQQQRPMLGQPRLARVGEEKEEDDGASAEAADLPSDAGGSGALSSGLASPGRIRKLLEGLRAAGVDDRIMPSLMEAI